VAQLIFILIITFSLLLANGATTPAGAQSSASGAQLNKGIEFRRL
jgi:hypothetical protein